jgi:hypothetical protein
VTLGWLIFQLNVGDYSDFWFSGRILTYLLMLIAPALTFVPVGKALDLKTFGYWTIASWAIFGYVLTFVPSNPQNGPGGQNLVPLIILMASFFAVMVSIFMPICFAIGTRLSKPNLYHRHEYSRAWREAFMLSGYVVLMAFLRTIGGFSGFNALIMFLILVVVELLFLVRTR